MIKFDEYEIGILINCLMEMRNKFIGERKATDAIDNLLMKLIDRI